LVLELKWVGPFSHDLREGLRISGDFDALDLADRPDLQVLVDITEHGVEGVAVKMEVGVGKVLILV